MRSGTGPVGAWGERWWGVSGIVFVVLFFVAFALIGNSGDTGAETLAFYEDNGVRVTVAYFLFSASAVAYVWFVAAVRSALARAEPDPRGLSGLGFGAGMVTAALVVVGAAPLAALNIATDDAGAGAADAFYALSGLAYPILTTGIAVSSLLALATGLVVLRTGLLPRWVGWASVVAAPIILLAVLFIPIFVFLGWVTAVSAALLMQRSAAQAASARP